MRGTPSVDDRGVVSLREADEVSVVVIGAAALLGRLWGEGERRRGWRFGGRGRWSARCIADSGSRRNCVHFLKE